MFALVATKCDLADRRLLRLASEATRKIHRFACKQAAFALVRSRAVIFRMGYGIRLISG